MHLFVHWLLHFRITLQNNFCIVWKTSLLLSACLSRSSSCSWWTIAKRWLTLTLLSNVQHSNWSVCSAKDLSLWRSVIVRLFIEFARIGIGLLAVVGIFPETLRHVFAGNGSNRWYIISHIWPRPNTQTFLCIHAWADRLLASVAPSTICYILIGIIQWQLVRIDREMVNRLEPQTPK